MRRISVVGTSGSGKTMLAARLAASLGVPHVELDALHWQPGWVEVASDVLRERVAQACAGEDWVIDGNYAAVRDFVWSRRDTVVFLDYSFLTVLGRSIGRTLRRIIRRESCCNGNYESVGRSFSRDSIVLWVLQTYWRRRREYAEVLPKYRDAQGGEVVILRSPKEADR